MAKSSKISAKTANFSKFLEQLSTNSQSTENDPNSQSCHHTINNTQKPTPQPSHRQRFASYSASSGFNKAKSIHQPQWRQNHRHQSNNNNNRNISGFRSASMPPNPKLIESTMNPVQQRRALQKNKMAMLDGKTKWWGKMREYEKGAPPADDAPLKLPRLRTPLQGQNNPNRYNYNNSKTQYIVDKDLIEISLLNLEHILNHEIIPIEIIIIILITIEFRIEIQQKTVRYFDIKGYYELAICIRPYFLCVQLGFEYPSDPSSNSSEEGIYKSSKHDPAKITRLESQRMVKQMQKSMKLESSQSQEDESTIPALEVDPASLDKLEPIMMIKKQTIKTPSAKKVKIPSKPKKRKRRKFKRRLFCHIFILFNH